jgi:Uncharacterised protein family (UPF0236)
VQETVYYATGIQKCIRPFSLSAGISCKRYSQLLQRAIADFGSDNAFGQVDFKLKEHYGIAVPTSSARIITQHHAHEIFLSEASESSLNVFPPHCALILAETDGSMIPIMKPKERPEGMLTYDARKHKNLFWREARLSFARPISSVTPIFAATLGKPEVVGKQLYACARKSGMTDKSKIHCLGDGAPWIVNQIDEQFGTQARYLVDFYHVCEYLGKAALSCDIDTKAWCDQQKERLKTGKLNEVLFELKRHLEPNEKNESPVRDCYRYLSNRKKQLDYAGAIEKGLPIGSGEIESAHRYVIQKRLKIAGAWWKEENAADMLALRVKRQNNNWNGYWTQQKVA